MIDPELASQATRAWPSPGRVRSRRRRVRRLAAAALIVYGVLGLTAILAAVGVLSQPLQNAGNIGESVLRAKQVLVETLDATADSFDNASRGFGNLGSSLNEARAATGRAAGISRSVAITMRELAGAMGLMVPILNVQPFIGLSPGFQNAGDQLDLLAGDLESVGVAISQNATDLTTSRADLEGLGARVIELRDIVDGIDLAPTTDQTFAQLRLAMIAVVVWLAAQAVLSLVFGLVLWASAARRF